MSASYMRKCTGKKRHESREIAEKAAASLRNGSGFSGTGKPGSVAVYRCDQCSGWHVGGASKINITRQRRSGKRPNKRMRGR